MNGGKGLFNWLGQRSKGAGTAARTATAIEEVETAGAAAGEGAAFGAVLPAAALTVAIGSVAVSGAFMVKSGLDCAKDIKQEGEMKHRGS